MMENNGRLLCPLCRHEHADGVIKPGITLCVPCTACKANYDITDPHTLPDLPPLEAEIILEVMAIFLDLEKGGKQCS